MSVRFILTSLFLFIFLTACVQKSAQSNDSVRQDSKVLFDALNIIGRTSSGVDAIFGKPYLVTGESKSDPTLKSRWNWYRYEKDLSIFFDRDTRNDIATSITLIFKNRPKDANEAASMVGIDLSGRNATETTNDGSFMQETFRDLMKNGNRYVVVFASEEKGDSTIKVFTDK